MTVNGCLAQVESEHPDFVALKAKYANGEEVGSVPLPAGANGIGELRVRFRESRNATYHNLIHRDTSDICRHGTDRSV